VSDAAIVCDHVALFDEPILRAVRDEPLEEVDSGWQFLCGGDSHSTNAKIWAVHEVLSREPTLAPFIDLPPGTSLWRESAQDEWNVESS